MGCHAAFAPPGAGGPPAGLAREGASASGAPAAVDDAVTQSLRVLQDLWVDPLLTELQGGVKFQRRNMAFVQCYSAVLDCGDDPAASRRLYEFYKAAVARFCEGAVRSLRALEAPEAFLPTFLQAWEAFMELAFELHRVFQYLDRYFTGKGSTLPPLTRMALDIFRSHAYEPFREPLLAAEGRPPSGAESALTAVRRALLSLAPQLRRPPGGGLPVWEGLVQGDIERLEAPAAPVPVRRRPPRELVPEDLEEPSPPPPRRAPEACGLIGKIRSAVAVRDGSGGTVEVPAALRPASAVYPLHTVPAPMQKQAGKILVEALAEVPRPLCPAVHVGCITPCPFEELEPLLSWLRSSSSLPRRDLSFPRGTVCSDGRLDLCKQALGPLHCKAVVEAIPAGGPVRHLLLGMDGLGDDGAKAVAELVQARDPLETVFLGCNAIRSEGMKALAESIAKSNRVRNLWLKRNPLGLLGAEHLAGALRLNSQLRTLDITNTMLGDDGTQAICSALTAESSLERMYLGGNGITAAGAAHLGSAVGRAGALKELFLECNRLRDDGMTALLQAGGGGIETLNLASNGVGEAGIATLIASCTAPLVSLDLGRAPSAGQLGEAHNSFGDAGADLLVEWLLRGEGHPTITKLELGWERMSGVSQAALHKLFGRNRAARSLLVPASPLPADVAAIQSVYRLPGPSIVHTDGGGGGALASERVLIGAVPTSTLALSDGRQMPQLALGTYRLAAGLETFAAVLCALRAGYRHVDTAELYGNEADVGAAVRRFLSETGLPRSAVWVTTKYDVRHGEARSPRDALQESLGRMGLDYVDLYLIHKPTDKARRVAHWAAFAELRTAGLARSIGVANYGQHHLEELRAASEVVPAVNQIEVTPFLQRRELTHYCAERGICCVAHSVLTGGRKLAEPRLLDLAARHGVSAAQLLLRWALQRGLGAVMKSARPDRIVANATGLDFILPEADLQEMERWEDGFLSLGWDATACP